MATKREVVELCRSLGVVLTDEGDKLEMFAPRGKVFSGGVHCATIWADGGMRGCRIPRQELYADMLETLRIGLEPCTEPDCCPCSESQVPEDVPASAILT